MAQKITIFGSYGTVEIDEEGMPIRGFKGPQHDEPGIPDEYADIVRYDVYEYRNWLKEKTTQDPNAPELSVDCVDIGMWYISKETKKKEYCAAEEDHRSHEIFGAWAQKEEEAAT